MKGTILSLSKIETKVLAGVRLSVTVHLIAEAAALDSELRGLCEKPFSFALKAIGVRGAAYVRARAGRAEAFTGKRPEGPVSVALVFPTATGCARVLSGAGGFVLPVPLGPGFAKAAGFFKTAAGRAQEILRSPETRPDDRARLLLVATLRGLEAVSADPYLDKRMEHIPDGTVTVKAGATTMWAEKIGHTIRVLDTPLSIRPQAALSFSGAESAIAVLSGKRQAVVALGSGEVSTAGLLPLVQGLFAVLDRLSWYLEKTENKG